MLEGPKRRVVFLDRNAIRAPLRKLSFPHEWHEYSHTPPELTVERLKGAEVAITNRVPMTSEVLDAVPSLELIAVCATGYEHVDVDGCARRGVAVCNVRDWSLSVPEHVFAMTLALRRQLASYQRAVAAGHWQASSTYGVLLDPLPITLQGSAMGVIGYGALGRRVAALAEAFGMTVLVAERKGAAETRVGRTPFEAVLADSHVIVTLCPLTDDTRDLIGEDELGRMRRDAIVVNCARGGIVNEDALSRAVAHGTIAGAAVDVLSSEPPRFGNPLLNMDLPNLIVTPHVAFASVQSLEALAEQLIGNIEAFFKGEPRNLVTVP